MNSCVHEQYDIHDVDAIMHKQKHRNNAHKFRPAGIA
jgi:hypothetical protein